MKAVWLLDIDGVVNALCWHDVVTAWPRDCVKTGSVVTGDETWPICWATPVVDFIHSVVEENLAEVRWHSTWQHEAANFERLVGLPNLPVHEAPEYGDRSFTARAIREQTSLWWKEPGARRVVEVEQRPLVWTDDDIFRYCQEKSNAIFSDTLMIFPDSNVGLTPGHLESMAEFFAKHV